MVKDEKKELPSTPAKSSKSLFGSSAKPVTEVAAEVPAVETTVEMVDPEGEKTLPKIRLRVEEEAGKVKQFATAQGLSMHIKVTKAKRAGLSALHKMATWLTPKK